MFFSFLQGKMGAPEKSGASQKFCVPVADWARNLSWPANYHVRNRHIRKLFSLLLVYNSLKPHSTGMHIGIETLLL